MNDRDGWRVSVRKILAYPVVLNELDMEQTNTIMPCYFHWLIGLVGSVFTNGPTDLGSIPGRVIPKTLTMVLDTSLLNTQPYKVRIEGKVEQSRERSSTLPYTAV